MFHAALRNKEFLQDEDAMGLKDALEKVLKHMSKIQAKPRLMLTLGNIQGELEEGACADAAACSACCDARATNLNCSAAAHRSYSKEEGGRTARCC